MAQRVDEAHERTDKTIEEIEKQLEKEYQQASKEVTAKWEDYWRRHAAKDSIKQQQVASGKITLEEYAEWKHGQLCVGQRWKDLKDQLAQDLVNVDEKARSITQGYMPEVYALNHNYATFQVEKDSMIDTSYTLYNRRAVENMIRDDRSLLPYPKKDSKTDKMLRANKDLVWNRQHIHSAITQGILQGESNPQIAMRLRNVVGMDKKAAIRNARTMMTGVENKARKDAYDDLRDKGIDIREKWIATLDGRTRSSHRWMHGTYKDEKGVYENGLEYPGDPKGDPAEVYNCRCCEIAEVMGHSIETPKYSPKIKGMSFDEWQRAKGSKESLRWYNPPVQSDWSLENLKDVPWETFRNGLPYDDYRKVYYGLRPKANESGMRFGDYYEALRDGKINDSDAVNLLLKYTNAEMINDPYAYKMLRSLEKSGIYALPLEKIDEAKSIEQFVKDVAGGDMTKGSCASLSLCYAANVAGYDIKDFRGGDSQDWFATTSELNNIADFKGVKAWVVESPKPIKTTMKMLDDYVTSDKFMLYTGRHAAIVTKAADGTFRYLELQSRYESNNGWHTLDEWALANRFKATKTSKYGSTVGLIDINSLSQNENFPNMMQYINTETGKQKKGSSGYEK